MFFDLFNQSYTINRIKYSENRKAASEIARLLRTQVQSGERPPGARLPSHLDGAAEWNCDRATVRAAYGLLQAEGLVEIKGNAGTFVALRGAERFAFDWNRFWVRDGTAGGVYPDGPFLLAFDSALSGSENIRTLEQLDDEPLVVLLGEAGMGKTHTLKRLEKRLLEQERSVLRFEGGRMGLWQEVRERILRGCNTRRNLAAGSPLVLIVDAIDETKETAARLVNAVSELQLEVGSSKLHVRISCRSTAWADFLHATAYEKDSKQRRMSPIWRLMPLRRADAVLALKRVAGRTGDPEQWCRDPALAVLASRPITLLLLLRAAAAGKLGGPTSLTRVFQEGIAELLSGVDQRREDGGQHQQAGWGLRLAIARRLAAVALVCGDTEFEFRLNAIDPDAIGVDEALGRTPTGGGQLAPASSDREAIREVLNSAVFDQVRPGVYRFAHKSYAEFLAADYLHTSGLKEHHVRSFLWTDDGRQRRLIPELIETAAWLAAMSPTVFDDIMEHQPEVLLLSDTPAFTDEQREQLVGAYLRRVHNGLIPWDRIRALEDSYPRLAHPGLAAQVRGFLRDATLSDAAREVAVEIAERASLSSCVPDLVDLVLGAQTVERLRVSAAYAVRSLGCDAQQAARLRSIAMGEVNADEDQSILGCVLHLLWPKHMNAADLFRALVPQFRNNLYGGYAGFLTSSDLANSLKDDDLPAALDWAARQPLVRGHRDDIETACATIMYRAWRSIDRPGVADAMAPIVLDRLDRTDHFMARAWDEREGRAFEEGQWIVKEIASSPARRRLLADAMIRLIARRREDGPDPRVGVYRLMFGDSRLAHREDLEWLIQRACASTGTEQTCWIELANRVVLLESADAWTSAERDLLAAECAKQGRPKELLGFLEAVGLDSEKAESLRKDFSEYRKLGRRQRRPEKRRPALREIIESWFAAVPANPAGVWPGIAEIVLFGESWETNQFGMWSGGKHMTDSKLWETADSAVRERLVDAAERMLNDCSPVVEWLISSPSAFSMTAYMREGLFLLASEKPEVLENLTDERWAAWAPLLAASTDYPTPENEAEQLLTELAYARAPNRVVDTLLRIAARRPADAEAHDHGFSRLWRWERVADHRLSDPLEKLLMGLHAPHRWQITHALRLLLKLDQDAGLRVARRYLQLDASSPDASPESLSIAAAAALVRWHEHAGWTDVWPRLTSSTPWARSLHLEIVGDPVTADDSFISRLDDEELGKLVEWLYCDLDIGELPDRMRGGVYTPSPAETVRDFRELARRALENRASSTAIAAFESMCRRLPNDPWLRDGLLKLLDHAASKRRSFVSPEDLDRLVEDGNCVFVDTPEQLLDLVTASLERLQSRLQHSESPLREILWNRCKERGKPTPPTPKDETHLSMVIKDHLETDLVGRGLVINREVEILRSRQSVGDEQGKRIDLLVQASAKSGSAATKISVVIEVKLDTNTPLVKGLEEQLFDRYLDEYRSRHGLFVVGATEGLTAKSKSMFATLQARAQELTNRASRGRVVKVCMIDCGLGPPSADSMMDPD